jgi:hypothetical protein
MVASEESPDETYAALCEDFLGRTGVGAGTGTRRGFGSTALTVDGRIFAMLTRGRLVVKLPGSRVAQLVGDGWGVHFDANKGRPMREWLVIEPERTNAWTDLAGEALVFVGGSGEVA